MKVYQLNWQSLLKNLLSFDLRSVFVLGWLSSLIEPVVQLHINLLNYRDHCLYRVRHNSQIVYMEAVLNDKFDNELRRIRIINSEFKEGFYFYELEDNKEVYFYEPEDNQPVYFKEPDEFDGDGVDFLVCVPPDLEPSTEALELALTTKIKGQTDYYKLYSKNYKIAWVLVDI
jgi:hypothetical protein